MSHRTWLIFEPLLPPTQPSRSPRIDDTVESGSITETIVKTGPGVFTRAVMTWMVANAAANAAAGAPAEESGYRTNTTAEASALGSDSTATDSGAASFEDALAASSRGDSCAGAGGAPASTPDASSSQGRQGRGDAADTAAAAPPAAAPPVAMVLPPSYFYPIPNNAVVATGDLLIGDGMESGVRERAERFFGEESLAAHLWGRSWQGKGER